MLVSSLPRTLLRASVPITPEPSGPGGAWYPGRSLNACVEQGGKEGSERGRQAPGSKEEERGCRETQVVSHTYFLNSFYVSHERGSCPGPHALEGPTLAAPWLCLAPEHEVTVGPAHSQGLGGPLP